MALPDPSCFKGLDLRDQYTALYEALLAALPPGGSIVLPASANTGDLFVATAPDTMGTLADVAVNNVLLSGGVGAVPSFGKVTGSHTDGTTIATIAAGVNSNITTFTGTNIAFSDGATFNNDTQFNFALLDSGGNPGNPGDLLSSTGTGTLWVPP